VLVALRKDHAITDAAYWQSRHRLRAAGYYAMTVEEGEVEYHLSSAPVSDKTLRETPELRSIRESLALPLVNRSYLPTEHPWLNGVRFEIFKALRNIWLDQPLSTDVEAKADWLLSVAPDPRSWCPDPENDGLWQMARNQAAVQAALLLVFPFGDVKLRRRYYAWAEKRLVKPLRDEHPQLWDAALDFLKQYIGRLVEVEDET